MVKCYRIGFWKRKLFRLGHNYLAMGVIGILIGLAGNMDKHLMEKLYIQAIISY